MNSPELEKMYETMIAGDHLLSGSDARIIKRMILADGHVDKSERKFLRQTLEGVELLDDSAFHILLDVLLTGKRLH